MAKLSNTKKSNQTIEELLKEFDEIISKKTLDKGLPKTHIPTRKNAIKKISEEFTKENLVLVLGAGISVPFGVPTWESLLQRLMVFTIEKDSRASNILAKLFNGVFSPNPIIAGRYLQSYFQENNESFEEAVRQVLYSSVNKHTQSELMDEIVNFCVAPGKSPNLNSILTYNFDDILESAIEKIGIHIPYKSIFGIGMDIKKGELPIYHIHGYLPEKGNLTSQNNITLGEHIYHKQYSDIYSWNNIVQINKFSENTCIFIGSSLTDPNIRRLLDISHTQKGKKKASHYIFKKRKGISEIEKKLDALLKETELLNDKNRANLNFSETVKLLTAIYKRFEENDSASFGVQTIWIEEYNEIPQILKEIRENVA
jgi:hypothetical protein